MIEKAIDALLMQSSIANSIHIKTIPARTELPSVSFMLVSDPKRENLDKTGYRRARVQVNAVAETYDQAYELNKEIADILDGSRGTFSGVQIYNIKEVNRVPDPSGTLNINHISTDYIISYGE